jgi:hypothetical protein
LLVSVFVSIESFDETDATIGEGKTKGTCWGVVTSSPTVNRLAPSTVNAADPVAPDVTADTTAHVPGVAHEFPKSNVVAARPSLCVVAVAGENDDPDGPVKDTAAPDTPAPDCRTDAVTVTAPDAGT